MDLNTNLENSKKPSSTKTNAQSLELEHQRDLDLQHEKLSEVLDVFKSLKKEINQAAVQPGDRACVWIDGDYGNPMLVWGEVNTRGNNPTDPEDCELCVFIEGYESGIPYENLRDYSEQIVPLKDPEEIDAKNGLQIIKDNFDRIKEISALGLKVEFQPPQKGKSKDPENSGNYLLTYKETGHTEKLPLPEAQKKIMEHLSKQIEKAGDKWYSQETWNKP